MRIGIGTFALAGILAAGLGAPASAETVMQQCGRQYQDAKAAGTLNGMNWNQFRTDCATRLKAQPASAPAAGAAAAPAAQTANPLNPAPAAVPATTAAAPAPAPAPSAPATPSPTAAAKPAATGGRAAFLVREKQCGAEWRANKATLTAQSPGLTWPKYLSQCNTRLKAAGK